MTPRPTDEQRSALEAFLDRHGLRPHVAMAQRLAAEEFKLAAPIRTVLEEDPETAAQWVEIGVSVSIEPAEVLEAYDRYTRRWLAAVPREVIGRVRLAYESV